MPQLNLAYTIQTHITCIWQHKAQQYVSGIGKDAIFKEVEGGWYVTFDGSYESLFFGMEAPLGWAVGDSIKITFQKAGTT